MKKKHLLMLLCICPFWAAHAELSEETASSTIAISQQNKRVTGVVVDQNGETIIGANVVEKEGTSNGTVTDVNDSFSLDVSPNATLVVSYIGYNTVEVAVGSQSDLRITLAESALGLEEVVGYGTVKKRDLTGSVSSVGAEYLKKVPVTSFDQAMQGRAAGVQVTQASSAPGGRVMILVRGGNSLTSSNEPLYVVDGYPIYAGSSAGGNGADQDSLSTINTSDIVSIEILKDASATAIYGARGANGVVLITTKRGQQGRTQVTFDGYYGSQTVAHKLDMMNAKEYATLVNEARANDGQAPVYPNPADLYNFPDISSLDEGVDWQDQVFRTAPIQSYSVGINGGNDNNKFSIGGSFFGQDGIIKNSDFQRASAWMNMDTKLSKSLTFSTNITASHVWGNTGTSEAGGGSTSSIVWSAISMPPTVPVFQEDGSYTMVNRTPRGTPTSNPIPIVEYSTLYQEIDRFLESFDLNWEIIKNLNLKITFGTDMSSANRKVYWPTQTYQGFIANGEASQSNRKMSSYLNENTLAYSNTFGNHSVNAVAGFTRQTFFTQNFSAGSKNYSTDLYKADNLGADTVYSTPCSYMEKSQLASYLGRINYIFKYKYLVTLTARADGSSKFGANNKWAFFPSAAIAWRLSEEEFMKPIEQMSNLKLRVSYGTTGNQAISSYSSLDTLGTMNYPIGGTLNSGVGPNRIPNPDLKWETTATTDIGIDLGLFNNRLNLVVDYYYKKTTDLLWNISTPSTTGFTTMFRNNRKP